MQNKLYKIVFAVVVVVLLALATVVFWPKSYPAVPVEMEQAFNSGDFAKVVNLANNLLSENPNNPYVLLFLSQTFAQKGSLEFKEKEYGIKAVDYAKQAQQFIPNDPRVYIAFGYAYEIMQNYSEAIKAYSEAIKLELNNADFYIQRGHAYDISGDFIKAKADYEKAKAIDPLSPKVAQNLGRLAIREGDTKEAEKQFNLVVSTSANNRLKAEAFYNLSTLVYYSSAPDKFNRSANYASSSITADPTYPAGYLGLGRAQVALKDYVKAETNINKSIELYSDYSLAYQILADLYSSTNKNKQSAEAFAKQSQTAQKDIGIMDGERASIVAKAALNAANKYALVGNAEQSVFWLGEAIKSADSLTLFIIQMAITDAPNNSFKFLIGRPTFEKVKNELNIKIESSLENNKKTTSLNYFKKLLSFFTPTKAEAAIVTQNCVIANQTISYNGVNLTITSDSSSLADTYAAKVACAELYKKLSGNGTYLLVITNNGKIINNGNTMTLAEIEAYIDSLIQQANAAHGLSSPSLIITGSSYYYGCANGLGSSYVPTVASAPTGLQASCIAPGTSATVSWNAVSGASSYLLRVNNTTANGWNNACDGAQNSGDICQSQTGTSLTFTSTPGSAYTWWVHSVVNGVTSLSSSGPNFSCSNAQISATCSASPSTASTNTPITWSVSASGGSGSYTYSWSGTDSLSGTNSSVVKSYSTTGTKNATVVVSTTYNGQATSTSISCPGTISGGSSCSNCGSGVNISANSFNGVCGQAKDTCNVGSFSDLSDTADNYLWKCLGSDNLITTDDVSCSLPIEVVTDEEENYNCQLEMVDQPENNDVSVNTVTNWQIQGDTPNLTWTRIWKVNDVEVERNNLDTNDIIFTTIGQKSVSVTFATSSGSTLNCGQDNSTVILRSVDFSQTNEQ